MAQYSGNPNTLEAYKVGNTPAPAWFDTALQTDKLFPVMAPGGQAIAGFNVIKSSGNQYAAIGDYLVNAGGATLGELTAYNATTFETRYLLDDATLTTVLTKAISNTSGTGAAANAPLVSAISVLNAVATVGLANIVAGTDATFKLYSDSGFTTEVTGANTINLAAGGDTSIYIKVTSKHSTLVLYYKVTITRAA